VFLLEVHLVAVFELVDSLLKLFESPLCRSGQPLGLHSKPLAKVLSLEGNLISANITGDIALYEEFTDSLRIQLDRLSIVASLEGSISILL
jgi:hypothetical protein